MGEIVSKVFGTYYLEKLRHDSTVLHYQRRPTWRSLVLFFVFFGLTHIISTQAEIWYLGVVCYLLGVYFSYIATEKYEECIFDKSKGTISLMNARFLEKHLLGYRKKIVTELDEIVGVKVDHQKILTANGYMVVLRFVSGLTLSLTAQCTYGDKREHECLVREIKNFLDIPLTKQEEEEKRSSVDGEKSVKHKDKPTQKKKL